MPELFPYDLITLAEDEPLVLAGPPVGLTGRVTLHNPGNVNVVVRDVGLKDPSGLLISRPVRHALPPLVLRPDQGRTVPLTVAVDPTTPPGEYRVELDVAGRSRSAVLYVAEVFDLTIQPKSIVVVNRPGQTQRKRVIVTNRGNVAFAIGDIGHVDLKDDMIFDRAMRVAIEPLTKQANVDIEELIVAVLRVVREDAYRAGSLLVRNLAGKVEVAPGKTAAIDLEITLRQKLPYNSRYRGRAPLLTQDLEIVVVPSRDGVEDEPPTKPAQRVAETTVKAATVIRKTTK